MASPDGAYQTKGTMRPADIVDSSICINACPEAAVPRILGCLFSAAKENIGIHIAIPILNSAIGKMLAIKLTG